MTEKPKFYITTAISYVNGEPHLGHAYEAISTDVIARFKRLDGFDVRFLTGTDEHGQKVERSAHEAGKEPQVFCDEIAASFRTMDDDLGVSYDDFIRTTEEKHYRASQAIWQKLAANDDIYLDSYAGWYSVRDEGFYGEDETEVDDDGVRRTKGTGTEVDWVEEASYFFRLSAYQDKLLAHYEANPDFILPHYRRNEVVSFVKQGLRDLSISRTSFNWGVPVPGDPDHIMYVWLDALTNYITALGYPDTDNPLWRYWPADVHIIGKDILRFHAIYWPAFLMSAGIDLPKCVFGHGFLTIEGQKMSKSLGNVVTPEAMKATFGLDQMRYFLMREVPYGNDGSFSKESIIQRINSDLANDIGNLGQRVLSMIAKNCGGRVPQPGPRNAEDETLIDAARAVLPIARDEMKQFQIHRMLEAIWRVVAEANRYVDAQAPWALRKTDPDRMNTVLYVLADVIRMLAIYVQPVVPDGAALLLEQLSIPENRRTFSVLDHSLEPGIELPAPAPVFPRFIEEEVA